MPFMPSHPVPGYVSTGAGCIGSGYAWHALFKHAPPAQPSPVSGPPGVPLLLPVPELPVPELPPDPVPELPPELPPPGLPALPDVALLQCAPRPAAKTRAAIHDNCFNLTFCSGAI